VSVVERINPRYRDALLEARERGFTMVRRGEQRLLATYAEMLVRISSDAQAGILTAERARALYSETLGAMVRFEAELATLTIQGRAATARAVQNVHHSALMDLYRQAGVAPPAGVLDRVATNALASMVARRENAMAMETVARRKLQAVASQLDTMLQAGVARGIDAGRGTMDVARMLAGDDTRILAMLDRMGAPRDLTVGLREGAGVVDWERWGVEPGDVKEIRTLFYDARRIQVSEMNNALREANTEALVESPVVTAAAWQVSGRHDFGNPDECSVLATADYYGLGRGVYPVGKFPLAPHPHCACTQGGPVKFRRPSEWGQPKPPAERLGKRPDDPEVTARFASKWTDNRRQRVEGILRGTLMEAERTYSRRLAS
jgi:hypothetical protein